MGCASVRLTASPGKGQLGTEAAMNSFHHRCAPDEACLGDRFALTRRDLLAATTAGLRCGGSRGRPRGGAAGSARPGRIHVSLAPTWFDPADTQA